jgi:hypothetical protein
VRQAPQANLMRSDGLDSRQPRARRRDHALGNGGEMLHPRAQRLLIGRARLNAQSAHVTNAIGWLTEKQRARWIAAVHERGERKPERVDVLCARILGRKMQPRARRNAFVGVTRTAARLLENWIHSRRK